MGQYNSNIGKWKPYVITPIKLDITVGTAGDWAEGSIDFEAYAVNDSKTDVTYEVTIAHVSPVDQYTWRYSTDGGTTWSEVQYADTSSTKYSIPCGNGATPALTGRYTSLDDGVILKFNTINGFTEESVVTFTTPSGATYEKNRKYINGMATTLDLSNLAEDEYGPYTDNIPLHYGSYTMAINYTNCTRDSLSNAEANFRTTIWMDASVDGTNYTTLYKPVNDYDFRGHNPTVHNPMLVSVFDKADNTEGGQTLKYKIRGGIVAGSWNVTETPLKHYMDIAFIKNY
jgi:hypothetical protein